MASLGMGKTSEKKNFLGIVVLDLPDELLDDKVLYNHFSKFGTIIKMKLDRKNRNSLIKFEKPDDAERAKEKGSTIDDHVVKILFTEKEAGSKLSTAALSRTKAATPPPLVPMDVAQSLKSSPIRSVKAQDVRSGVPFNTSASGLEVTTMFALYPDAPEAKKLFEKTANSAEERYFLLEERDKYIRARNPKVKVKVENAVKLVGTCRDMCPEKERYMREFQRQLVSYEMLPGKDGEVDHRIAIKAYSRSSADQEEPLPHELRPCETLEMSLLYLLHRIIPVVEDSSKNEIELANWYNFVWDRTRSIRKDITQQQLYDLRAVFLMEKCARFHIFCSSRLCELDRNNFDTKLNDENLMKCLQSLEHMYTDLNLVKVRCPNEPEFRAYQILMNLNEGDILWDAQQLPEWVRTSDEVQFAIKVHMAVFQKNYALFFKLVRKAPYLTACILHRYFYQVRRTALLTVIKAYSMHGKTDNYVSAPGIQAVLGFGDDQDSFLQFCQSHCVQLDLEREKLILNRRTFDEPEFPTITREFYLIDSKLHIPVNEVINGGSLEPDLTLSHVPHTSFDNQGCLIPGNLIGVPQDQVGFYKPVDKSVPRDVASLSLAVPLLKPIQSMPDIKVFPKPDLRPKVNLPSFPSPFSSETKAIASGVLTADSNVMRPGSPMTILSSGSYSFKPFPTPVVPVDPIKQKREKVLKRTEELVDGLILSVIRNVVTACRKEQYLRRKLIQREKERTQTALRIYNNIEYTVITRFIHRFWLARLEWQRNVSRQSAALMNNLTENVMMRSLRELSRICLNEQQDKWKERIARLDELMLRVRQRKWIRKWKRYAKVKNQQRKLAAEAKLRELENFPSYQNTVVSSPEDILENWAGGECCSPSYLLSLSNVSPRQNHKRDLNKELLKPVENVFNPDTATKVVQMYDFPAASNVVYESPAAVLASWCGVSLSPSKVTDTDDFASTPKRRKYGEN